MKLLDWVVEWYRGEWYTGTYRVLICNLGMRQSIEALWLFSIKGEEGACKFNTFSCKGKAIADFKKKFQDKTKNSWDKRDSFQAKSGKYTLLEVENDEEKGSGEAAPVPGKKV